MADEGDVFSRRCTSDAAQPSPSATPPSARSHAMCKSVDPFATSSTCVIAPPEAVASRMSSAAPERSVMRPSASGCSATKTIDGNAAASLWQFCCRRASGPPVRMKQRLSSPFLLSASSFSAPCVSPASSNAVILRWSPPPRSSALRNVGVDEAVTPSSVGATSGVEASDHESERPRHVRIALTEKVRYGQAVRDPCSGVWWRGEHGQHSSPQGPQAAVEVDGGEERRQRGAERQQCRLPAGAEQAGDGG